MDSPDMFGSAGCPPGCPPDCAKTGAEGAGGSGDFCETRRRFPVDWSDDGVSTEMEALALEVGVSSAPGAGSLGVGRRDKDHHGMQLLVRWKIVHRTNNFTYIYRWAYLWGVTRHQYICITYRSHRRRIHPPPVLGCCFIGLRLRLRSRLRLRLRRG